MQAIVRLSFSIAAVCAMNPAQAFELKGLQLGGVTTVPEVERSMGVECGVGAHDNQICNGQTTIGGVPAAANIVVSAAGRLQRLRFNVHSSSFDALAKVMTEKYGRPRTRRYAVQNGLGANFQQVELEWADPSARRIEMTKYWGSTDESLIRFSTAEDRKFMRDALKADKEDL